MFVAPDLSQTLGPAFQGIAEGLQKLINPDYEFQQHMKAALATNPELAQNLADLEATSPGTLKKLGFGKVGDAVSAIPQSAQSQIANANRATDVATGAKKSQAANATAGLDLETINGAVDAISKDPQLKADTIFKLLTGQTGAQRSTSASQATTAAAEAGVAPGVAAANLRSANAGATTAEAQASAAPSEAAAAQSKALLDRQAYDNAIKNLPNLQNVDFIRMARDAASGNLDMNTAAATLNTPGAGKAFELAIGVVNNERQDALERWIHSQEGGDRKDALLTGQAFQQYTATKYAGTLDAHKAIIANPRIVDQIRAKPPAQLTQEDKDVLHAADANDQLQAAQKVGQIRNLNTSISSDMGRLQTAITKGESQEAINTYIDNLNVSLAAKGQATGQVYTAKAGPRPEVGQDQKSFFGTWGEGSGLYFVDQEGKRVDPSVIYADPPTGNAKTQADAMRAYSILQGLTPEQRNAQLVQMQKQRPDIYKLVIPMIK